MSENDTNCIIKDPSAAYSAGWDAWVKGERESENPFAVNNWKYYEWGKGWLGAAKNKGSTE